MEEFVLRQLRRRIQTSHQQPTVRQQPRPQTWSHTKPTAQPQQSHQHGITRPVSEGTRPLSQGTKLHSRDGASSRHGIMKSHNGEAFPSSSTKNQAWSESCISTSNDVLIYTQNNPKSSSTEKDSYRKFEPDTNSTELTNFEEQQYFKTSKVRMKDEENQMKNRITTSPSQNIRPQSERPSSTESKTKDNSLSFERPQSERPETFMKSSTNKDALNNSGNNESISDIGFTQNENEKASMKYQGRFENGCYGDSESVPSNVAQEAEHCEEIYREENSINTSLKDADNSKPNSSSLKMETVLRSTETVNGKSETKKVNDSNQNEEEIEKQEEKAASEHAIIETSIASNDHENVEGAKYTSQKEWEKEEMKNVEETTVLKVDSNSSDLRQISSDETHASKSIPPEEIEETAGENVEKEFQQTEKNKQHDFRPIFREINPRPETREGSASMRQSRMWRKSTETSVETIDAVARENRRYSTVTTTHTTLTSSSSSKGSVYRQGFEEEEDFGRLSHCTRSKVNT